MGTDPRFVRHNTKIPLGPRFVQKQEKYFQSKQHHCQPFSIGHMAYGIVNLFTYFRAFLNIFQNILTPPIPTILEDQKMQVQGNKWWCIQHPPKFPPLFATMNAKEQNTFKEESIDTNLLLLYQFFYLVYLSQIFLKVVKQSIANI